MSQQTMTVQRALTRRKIIAKRLEELTGESLISVTKEANKENDIVKQSIAKSQSLFDEFNSLVVEYSAISNAIYESNLKTTVRFRGENYSVAHLIALKEVVRYRKQRLQYVRTQHKDANRLIETAEDTVNKQIHQDTQALLGSNSEGKAVSLNEETQRILEAKAREAHAKIALVGFDVLKFIESESDFIDEFEQEVDILLSESNAVTTITI